MYRRRFKTLKNGREKILNYVKEAIKKGIYPKRIDIEKEFSIDLRSYFKHGIKEIYKLLNFDYKLVEQEIINKRIKLAMLRRRRFASREEGKKIISNFITKKYKEGSFVTLRDIQNYFHISIRTYFKNISEAYRFSGLIYPRQIIQSGPKKIEEKLKLKEKILNFIKNEIRKDKYPTMKQIQAKFHIELKTYFPNGIREVYNSIGKEYSNIRKIHGIRNNTQFKNKREGMDKIANFIRMNIKKGIYLGYNEICSKLNLNLKTYFSGIREAYEYAGFNYEKKSNHFILLEKERKLINISSKYLKSYGFTIIRSGNRFGEDMLIKDTNGNLIPVEIKAYHKTISIPNRLSYLGRKTKNEIDQIERYIKKYNSDYGILITSTNKIRLNIPENVKIINGEMLFNFLKKNYPNLIKDLKWIRNSYNTEEKERRIKEMKNNISRIFKQYANNGILLNTRKIEIMMKIDLRTYFPNGIGELYSYSNIKIPNNIYWRLKKVL
ncbi:MAG: hypothetical protein J7K26_01805 [Candidatus Aenigmarchaeota archaeon]|nr:hypothetical protein [Candidatus Aenigmarchaeota archaeon]